MPFSCLEASLEADLKKPDPYDNPNNKPYTIPCPNPDRNSGKLKLKLNYAMERYHVADHVTIIVFRLDSHRFFPYSIYAKRNNREREKLVALDLVKPQLHHL